MPYSSAMAQRFFNDIVSSPVNMCLVALICYFSYKLLRKEAPKAPPKPAREALAEMDKQDFTLEQLKQYDGVNSESRVLIGVLGRVFDVSSSDFYRPGLVYKNNGNYSCLCFLSIYNLFIKKKILKKVN